MPLPPLRQSMLENENRSWDTEPHLSASCLILRNSLVSSANCSQCPQVKKKKKWGYYFISAHRLSTSQSHLTYLSCSPAPASTTNKSYHWSIFTSGSRKAKWCCSRCQGQPYWSQWLLNSGSIVLIHGPFRLWPLPKHCCRRLLVL